MASECAVRTAQFNVSWFYPEELPATWRLEFAFYVLCMTLLFASIAVRLLASVFWNSDWLRARSTWLMIMCHIAALIQFQTGGLSKVLGSQIQCWFQVLGSLLIVPVCLIPSMVKLIWVKSSAAFNEAVRVGVHDIVNLQEFEEEEFNLLKQRYAMGRLVKGRSQILSTEMSDNRLRKVNIIRNLQRWRFWSSSQGVGLVFTVFLLPFIVLSLITFAFTDTVFLTTCTGCSLDVTHNLFIIVFAIIGIILTGFFIYSVRGLPDPFGHVTEVYQAMFIGALMALIGFILNFAIPAESFCDGWSWNIVVAIGLLTFSVIQGGYQVWVARAHHTIGDVQAVRAPVRQTSIVDPSSNLHELMQLVFTKKQLHDAFEQYLCSEFAVESLSFLDAVNDFKNAYYDRGGQASTSLAKRIVRTFVMENSTLTINVSSSQRHELVNRIEGLKEGDIVSFDTFDECYLEIFKMVQLGPLVRFTHTPKFKALCGSGLFDGAIVPISKITPASL